MISTEQYSLKLQGKKNKSDFNAEVEQACNLMDEIYTEGYYPKVTVTRTWSEHNPVIEGEFARPEAIRWYLEREFLKMLRSGADIKITPSRPAISLNDPLLMESLDEDEWDFTQKKMFLFRAERIDLSLNRLEHYTGTRAEDFQRYILFTNYDMHVEVFKQRFPDCIGPSHPVQMPAYHYKMDNNMGFTLINIGVGPSNAKTCTDHVSVLRPDCMVMVGHCGGLRNRQEIGDFVLAADYMRDDRVLDDLLPLNVPITPTHILNIYLEDALKEDNMNYRIGTVYTTSNRNWEFTKKRTVREIHVSRSIAIDMESATIAANGFRYRVPHATLLCVSDKPLHGKPKLSDTAQAFYQNSKERHLEMVINALNRIKQNNPNGLPNASIRAINEPLMGGGV